MATQKIRYDIEAAVSGGSEVNALASSLEGLAGTLEDDLKTQALASAAALRQLGEKQGAIDNFVSLKTEAQAAADRLNAAQLAAQSFARELAANGAPTRAQAGQLQRLRDSVREANSEMLDSRRSVDGARDALSQYGVATKNLAAEQRRVKDSIEEQKATFDLLGEAARTSARERVQAETAAANAAQAAAQKEAAIAAQRQRVIEAVSAANTRAVGQARAAEQARQSAAAATQAAERNRAEMIERYNLRESLSQQALLARLEQVRAQYPRLGAAAQAAGAQQAQAATEARQGLNGLGEQLRTIQGLAVTALGGSFLGTLVGDVARTADQYNNLAARIRLASGEGEAFEAAMAGVSEIALRTNSSLESTGTLFARLTDAGKNAGLGAAAAQAQALSLTETINQAVQVSGASATASDAALTQLIQGLQSGVLRGEEFNSVMEQSPRLARALADGLGVTTGELRKMANQGALTTEVVIGALKSQADTLKTEYATLPPTIGRAIQNLSTSWTVYVGEADKATGASVLAARAISALAENLDEIAAFATRAGAVLVVALAVQAAGAVRTYAAEVLAAKTATGLLALEMGKVPKNVQISVAAVGFEIGFKIGEMLRENFALARKFGVGLVAFFQQTVNGLRLVSESAAAIFTSDTIDAALDRYMQRTKTLTDIVRDMLKDAEKAPEAVTAAAVEATKATEQIEKSAKAAATELKGAATEAKALGSESAAAGAAGAAGLDKIKQEADAAAEAMLQLQEASKAKPQAMTSGVQLGLDLKKAADQGKDLEKFLESNLPAAVAKLSGPELEKFKTDFTVAMQVAGSEGKVLETGLRIIGERAAQSLGVDLVAAGTRVGSAFKLSEQNLTSLLAALPALKATGVDVGQAVGQALTSMINAAKNGAELEELRERVESLRGQLGEPVVGGLLEQLGQRAREVTGAVGDLAAALKKLGISSDADLSAAAAASRRLFEQVRATGGSAREQAEAFRKMAADAIASGDKTALAFARAQAGAQGMEIATDSAGRTIVRAMGEAAAATQGAGAAADSASGSYQSMGQSAAAAAAAVQRLADVNRRFSRPGEAPGPSGQGGNFDPGRGSIYSRPGDNPVNGNGQTQAEFQRAEKLKGQGALDMSLQFNLRDKLNAGALTEADLKDLQAVVASLKGNEQIDRSVDRLSAGAFSLQGSVDRREWQNTRKRFEDAIGELQGRNGRTVKVEIKTPAGTRTVQTDQAGADALIRSLQDASLASGR